MTLTDELIENLECPSCRQVMHTTFCRTSGPVMELHSPRGGRNRSLGKSCRLVVTPALRGDDHRVEVVPDNVRIETVLKNRRQEWKELHWPD